MAVNTSTFDAKALRRRFIAVQAAKGAVGAVLALSFAGLVGRPGGAETVAMAGLAAPLVLALLGFLPISLARLEQAGLILFAGVIGYLAVLTGGVVSPLVVWFALVPAEAALAGGRSQVVRAGFAAAAAFLVVASLEAADMLPLSRLTLPWEIYAVSVLAALAQAVLVAAASQDRQRAADKAAAEGTAMYRFLADHAMDLITRHSADGRIRFASPASYPLLGRLPAELEGQAMAALVHSCWVSFAKTGAAACTGAPTWPTYTPASDQLMEFGLTADVRTNFRKAQRDAVEKADGPGVTP